MTDEHRIQFAFNSRSTCPHWPNARTRRARARFRVASPPEENVALWLWSRAGLAFVV